nr:GNAT family N-acetyltransferase [Angustibacter aerolatus]
MTTGSGCGSSTRHRLRCSRAGSGSSSLGSADAAEIAALLTAASPRHSADPGDDDVVAWVGVRDAAGELLACAAHTEHVPGVPHLASIAVHPAARGQGFGGAVTAAVSRRALQHGAEVVTLGMYADNVAARRVYQRLGFHCRHHWSSRRLLPAAADTADRSA